MDQNKELYELSHAPWPGYLKAFSIVFAALTLYLGFIFIKSPDGNPKEAHHGAEHGHEHHEDSHHDDHGDHHHDNHGGGH